MVCDAVFLINFSGNVFCVCLLTIVYMLYYHVVDGINSGELSMLSSKESYIIRI